MSHMLLGIPSDPKLDEIMIYLSVYAASLTCHGGSGALLCFSLCLSRSIVLIFCSEIKFPSEAHLHCSLSVPVVL